MEEIPISIGELATLLNISKDEVLKKFATGEGEGQALRSQSDINQIFKTELAKYVGTQRSLKEGEGTNLGKRLAFEELEKVLETEFGIKPNGRPGGWKDSVRQAVNDAKESGEMPKDEVIKNSQVFKDEVQRLNGIIEAKETEVTTLKKTQRDRSVKSALDSLIESVINDSELNLNVHSGDSEDDKKRREMQKKAYALLLQSDGITLEPHPDDHTVLVPMKDGKQIENDAYHPTSGKAYATQHALAFFGQKAGDRKPAPLDDKGGGGDGGSGGGGGDDENPVFEFKDLDGYNKALDEAIEANKDAAYLKKMETHYESIQET